MLKHLTKSILLIELRSIFKEIMNDLDFQNNLPVIILGGSFHGTLNSPYEVWRYNEKAYKRKHLQIKGIS